MFIFMFSEDMCFVNPETILESPQAHTEYGVIRPLGCIQE